MTVVSMTEFNDVVEPQGRDRKSSSEKETYSLVIVLKSLVLTTVSNDDPRMVDIGLVLGETEAKLNGSLEFLNEQRQGTAIRYLKSSFLEHRVSNKFLCYSASPLQALKNSSGF